MKIGFDIDGVLANQDTAEIILIKENSTAEMYYYATREPMLRTSMFLAETDKCYIITCRKEEFKEITEKWCSKHYPGASLVYISVPQWKSTEEIQSWFKEVAVKKAETINELKLDVYFEDMVETVFWLRELCPNCKIIQYGGRVK